MKKSVVCFSVLLLVARVNFAQHGVGPFWGPEKLLPKANPNSSQRGQLFNNMVVTSTGRVIITTTELNPNNSNQILGHYFTYSDDGGDTWLNPPKKFTPTSLVIGGSSPKLMIDDADVVYVLWTAKSPAALFCSRLDANLNVLTDSVRVGSKVLYDNFSTHLTIDRKNRLHAMWHEGNLDLGHISEVYYARSTDRGQTWSRPVMLSANDGRKSAFPHAEFETAGDTLAIPWRDSVSVSEKWNIIMATSTNGGANWSTPQPVVTGTHIDSDPDLVVDSFNRLHLFYHQYPTGNAHAGANIRYAYSDDLGATWNPRSFRQLSENGIRSHLLEGSRYDPVRNVLWTTWKDERDFFRGQARADMKVAYSLDRGATWLPNPPEFATDWDTLTIGFKAAAIFPNGDFAVNYEVFFESGGAAQSVYFRKRQGVITGVQQPALEMPQVYALAQNYPNPFNPSTVISFQLPVGSHVTLKVFDVNGREVATLVDGEMAAGNHTVTFAPHELAGGIYFYQLTAGKFSQTRKAVLIQ
ncbi:MAG: T9SS type A sorting domain-containing protein [candidate division KSB1 bacterium]|nr:T9SS type A sorting domain-containing protein [candidate division KSB1 bacterium]MDZ7274134.1 T9SS type A sorting domain-containing protein [candidate division KSB1 bacterium]MDZ7287821.1 T9SS type A sorting domain-containing protein [candidate division KSB1 bacterium]MDZ7296733.1 T9SS type A sorting domain-containing protein [candidate division KSB1 bacterium]MDZ7307723.1 T9SS type A sorting domain-containing protein [candidate division KSB1 bacterium]